MALAAESGIHDSEGVNVAVGEGLFTEPPRLSADKPHSQSVVITYPKFFFIFNLLMSSNGGISALPTRTNS